MSVYQLSAKGSWTRNVWLLGLASSLFFLIGTNSDSQGATVRFETSLGNFDVRLFEDEAPFTVENFMNYVEDGDYDASIFHRSVPGFVVQGGGYKSDFSTVPKDPPVGNEFGHSNVRGTLAMARAEPNSATNQWFFNLGDNSEHLDNQNGGFTVFGEVLGDGLEVIDAIAELETFGFAPPFTNLPLMDYTDADFPATPRAENLVMLQSIQVVPEPRTSILFILAALALIVTHGRRPLRLG